MDSVVLLFMLLVPGSVAFLVFWSLRNMHKQQQAWHAFAQRHRLVLAPDKRCCTGMYEGHRLELKIERRGKRKEGHFVTVLHLDLGAAVSRRFSLRRERMGDRLLNLFARADEEIGQDDVDRYFELKNVDSKSARLLRHPEVRHQLFKVAKTYASFVIRLGQVSVETSGHCTSPEELESLIRPALTLVRTLKSATGGGK